jgi:hypothetical protein
MRKPFSYLRGTAAGLIAGLLVFGVVTALGARQEEPFPHGDHAGLFPVCTGCHQGIEEGDAEDSFPEPTQCSGCHDGVDLVEVSWDGPTERISNVRFDHVEHVGELEQAGDSAVTCISCHAEPGGPRMSVDAGPQLGTCWSCHAHERPEHFISGPEAECSVCHVPLADSGFDRERLLALEAPADHEAPDFLLGGHGEAVGADAARCSTCHVQDRCVACHVSPDLPEIASIPAAPAEMDQPVWEAEYPEPQTHEALGFRSAHAPDDGDTKTCATCHTRDTCLSCHVEPAPEPVASLPARSAVIAPGVDLDVHPPETHESPFFLAAHSNLAAADPGSCATCHTEPYCVACHDGPSDGGYHPPSFVSRHQADAWGRAQECATCHSTAAFCRVCHEQSGLGSQGRLDAGYHDAEPLWLIRHGGAARQNLESCASCHQQSDCVQCHGVLGSFQVSPHTSDFDAEAAWAKSPRTCIACHTSNPLEGGS